MGAEFGVYFGVIFINVFNREIKENTLIYGDESVLK